VPDAVDKALLLTAEHSREESVEELLAGAQEELDNASGEVLRRQGELEAKLLAVVGLLAASIVAIYGRDGQAVEIGEVGEEIRDAVPVAAHEAKDWVPGRILYLDLHRGLVELHRRSGAFTRLEDSGSALEFIKGAAYLAGQVVHAIESGRLQLLLRPD
jgi:hypothetical protein